MYQKRTLSNRAPQELVLMASPICCDPASLCLPSRFAAELQEMLCTASTMTSVELRPQAGCPEENQLVQRKDPHA